MTDIRDLLVCHYCLDKAFEKFYDMYTATWYAIYIYESIFLTSFCSYLECFRGEDYGYLKVNVKLKISIVHMEKCLFRSLEHCLSLTNITLEKKGLTNLMV